MARARRDDNYVTTFMGVSLSDLETPLNLVVDPSNNRLLVSAIVTGDTSGSVSSVLAGEKVVAASATPEALASDTDCSYVLIQAKSDNTSSVFVGNDTGQEVELPPLGAWAFAIDNLDKIYVRVVTNGDGVNYTGG